MKATYSSSNLQNAATTTTPTTSNSNMTNPTLLYAVNDFNTATTSLESNNIQQVVKGVNYLLQKSFDANQDSQTSSVVQIENYPRLLHAISDLLDLLNPAASLLEVELDTTTSYHVLVQQEVDGKAWPTNLIGSKNHEFKMINENVLAMNVTILKHVVSILAATAIHAVSMDATQLAIDIAFNLAHRFDFSGRKRNQVSTSYFEEESKDSLRFCTSRHMGNSGTVLYMQYTRALVTTLYHLLHEDNFINKYFVGRSLELLSKLVNANDKEPFVKNAICPHLLNQLSKFLAVSHTRIEGDLIPDGLAVSAADPLGRNRPLLTTLPPSVYNMVLGNSSSGTVVLSATGPRISEASGYKKLIPATYLTADNIDFELRDMAIDCLLVLCRNSASNAEHLYRLPRVVDLILRLAKMPSAPGTVGISNVVAPGYRSEGNNKAAALLGVIAGNRDNPENVGRLKRMRATLLLYTTCDDNIADMTTNKVHPSFLSGIEKPILNEGEQTMSVGYY